MSGYPGKESQTPMAQGRSTKIRSIIKWITSRLSTWNSSGALSNILEHSRTFWRRGEEGQLGVDAVHAREELLAKKQAALSNILERDRTLLKKWKAVTLVLIPSMHARSNETNSRTNPLKENCNCNFEHRPRSASSG